MDLVFVLKWLKCSRMCALYILSLWCKFVKVQIKLMTKITEFCFAQICKSVGCDKKCLEYCSQISPRQDSSASSVPK